MKSLLAEINIVYRLFVWERQEKHGSLGLGKEKRSTMKFEARRSKDEQGRQGGQTKQGNRSGWGKKRWRNLIMVGRRKKEGDKVCGQYDLEQYGVSLWGLNLQLLVVPLQARVEPVNGQRVKVEGGREQLPLQALLFVYLSCCFLFLFLFFSFPFFSILAKLEVKLFFLT